MCDILFLSAADLALLHSRADVPKFMPPPLFLSHLTVSDRTMTFSPMQRLLFIARPPSVAFHLTMSLRPLSQRAHVNERHPDGLDWQHPLAR